VALSLLVSAVLSQYQALREKVRHGIQDKGVIDPSNVFRCAVAPFAVPFTHSKTIQKKARPVAGNF
jgi:hypothetical protein